MENNILSLNTTKPTSAQTSIISKYKDQMVELDQPGKFLIPKMETQDFIDLQDHRIQRPYKKRLRKMKEHFDKNLKTLTDVSMSVATQAFAGVFNDNTISLEKDEETKTDAHTRAENWKMLAAKGLPIPEFVSCTVYMISSFEEYCNIYYSFDSSASVEKPNEKIAGTYDALNISVNSSIAKSGTYATALNEAYPGDPNDDIISKVSYFKDEIQLLDEQGVFGCKSGCQAVYAVALAQAKLNSIPISDRSRLTTGLHDLSNYKSPGKTLNDIGKFYGMDLCAYVYLGQDKNENEGSLHHCKVDPTILKKTNFHAMVPQLDFVTYCFDIYMTKTPKAHAGGVKRPGFKHRWDNSQTALLVTHPIANITVTEEDYKLLEEVNDE